MIERGNGLSLPIRNDSNCGRSDILEWRIPGGVLAELLKDHSTGGNIIWGTRDYERLGDGFCEQEEIQLDRIVDRDHPVIRPRVVKDEAEKRQRSRDKAEVFTPSWVCNAQNNLVDAAWFGRKSSPFNLETYDDKSKRHGWKTVRAPIKFPKGKTWLDYVFARRLEISCGEAPYLTSRYDAVSGEFIPVEERIGLLDRKLRVVGENFVRFGPERWIDAAKWSVQSVYGYDWQGDNVLLARENILFTVIEHFNADFCHEGMLSEKTMREFAEIIAWNVWQMDGIKFVVPYSCEKNLKRIETPNLDSSVDVRIVPCPGCKKNDVWSHVGTRCKVMDWANGRVENFMPKRMEGK